jgi:hypothetical protein
VTISRQILELLNGGDWACAYNERHSLAHVCKRLAVLVDVDHAAQARVISQVAASDMGAATKGWSELAADLRGAHVGAPGATGRRPGASAGAPALR